jgi:hypothetical protein
MHFIYKKNKKYRINKKRVTAVTAVTALTAFYKKQWNKIFKVLDAYIFFLLQRLVDLLHFM